MLTSEHVETAQRYLDDADRDYAAGDILQASEKLWGAASHVVIAGMKSRGVEVKTHRAMMHAVEDLAIEFKDTSLASEFATARYFHSNFYNGTMENHEFIADRPKVQRFVKRMLELTNDDKR